MTNLHNKYGQLQVGKGFYAIGKDMLQAFGATKAVFIAVLADLYDYAQKQGNERFFATLPTLMEKTKFADKTIKALMRELKSDGILYDCVKGEGLDNRKYYKINYEKIGELVCEMSQNTIQSGSDDRGKNTPNHRGKNTPNDRGKFTPNDKCKNTPNDEGKNTPNHTIDYKFKNLQEQNLQEQNLQTAKNETELLLKAKKRLNAKECLTYVKDAYEKLETKPKGDFNVFCAWIVEKAGKRGLVEYVLKRDFENYQRLDFLTKESPNDRLNRALQGNQRGVYQSLVFETDEFKAGGYVNKGLQHNSHRVNENFRITDKQKELFEDESNKEFYTLNVIKCDLRKPQEDKNE